MKNKLILSLFIIMILFATTGCSNKKEESINSRTNSENKENSARNDTKYNIDASETK